MLRLISSNSIEQLAQALAAELSLHRPADPLQAQQVLISTNAMSRWLALAISEELGICAGVDFDFGGRHLRRLVLELDGHLEPGQLDPWDPTQLRWPLAELLHSLPPETLWDPLRRLWQGQESGTELLDGTRLQVLLQLCDTLDQYGLYRPRMVRRWLQGENCDAQRTPLPEQECWQPALMRALNKKLEGSGVPHPAERLLNALEAAGQAKRNGSQADPLHVFGLSSLPPSLWQLLAQRAATGGVPVVLYQLSPSLEPWGGLPPQQGDSSDALDELENRLLYQGHPLLASLGRTQRDFHWQLELIAADLQERFAREPLPAEPCPADAGLLQRLKHDLLLGIQRGEGLPGVEPTLELEPEQINLQVLACHGDRRQVEEAHRALLALMAADPSLEPRHILVMTSDVARFTPLVVSVFERPGGQSDQRHLPVRVTDRTLRQRNPRIDLVFRLLELCGSRLNRDEVLDLLLLPEVASHLELSDLNQAQWRELLQASGISWGRDGRHRSSWGYPDDEQHSWRWGLDRLLLGLQLHDPFPLEDSSAGEWQNLAACHPTLATAPVVLALQEACGRLFEQLQRLEQPQNAAAWNQAIATAVQQLSGSGGDEGWQSPELYDLLTPLRDPQAEPMQLDRDAVVRLLEEAEAQEQGRYGHVSGAVTLSALEPMRSIPHRVVVLLGMDEQRLPRRDQRPGYDLMLQQPWRGDRDRRQEDRAILLEALQACSEQWIATYTASDPRTGEERNPAAPLNDLLRCLERSYRTSTGVPITEAVVQHCSPLPPLPPAQAAGAPWPQELEWPLEQIAPASLEELQQWCRDPARALLQAHGIRAQQSAELPEDPEESNPTGLRRWSLGQTLLSLGLERLDAQQWPQQRQALARRGQLPPGPAAELASGATWQRSRALLRLCEQLQESSPDNSVILESSSQFRPKRLLDGWIDHLEANSQAPRRTVLVGPMKRREEERAEAWTLLPLEAREAQQHLEELQHWRRQGLQRPIAWIPEFNWQLLSQRQQEQTELEQALPGLGWRQLQELNPPGREGPSWPQAWLQLCGGEPPPLELWLQQPEAWELTQRLLLPLSEALAAGGSTP